MNTRKGETGAVAQRQSESACHDTQESREPSLLLIEWDDLELQRVDQGVSSRFLKACLNELRDDFREVNSSNPRVGHGLSDSIRAWLSLQKT